jgi:hypothetical protein
MSKFLDKDILCAIGLGAVSGVCGTIAMDALWYKRYRQGGGNQGIATWEFAQSVTGWDNATDPGKVGAKVFQLVTRRPAPDSWARPASNVVHWLTGAGWGVQYSLLNRKVGRDGVALGLLLGPSAWISSYVVLPLLGVYKPIWKYDARTLAKDFSAHMLYGVVTAGALKVVST